MSTNRMNMYRLLARLYKKEISQKMIEMLDASGFLQGELGLEATCASEEDLAVDFARTFLAAGIAKGEAAFPFESVYTGKGRLVMQEAWEDMCRIYAKHGLGLISKEGEYLEDHIGCELEFMAYLIENDATVEEQAFFLEHHIANWVEEFTADVEHFASTEFYKKLAAYTCKFIAGEMSVLQQCDSKSVVVSNEKLNDIIQALSEQYVIYAPKLFMTGAGDKAETIKYSKVTSLSEIVTDKQSDFSPKESHLNIASVFLLEQIKQMLMIWLFVLKKIRRRFRLNQVIMQAISRLVKQQSLSQNT